MVTKPTNPTRKKERRDWKKPFLAALEKSPDVSRAAKAARVNRSHVYTARKDDEAFAEAWDNALAISVDAAEAELFRRAVTGIKKPVTIAGKRELIIEHSDTLLIFLLKSHRPETYRETVRGLNLNLTPEQLAGLSDAELDKLAAALSRRA